jgi:hypothetical protein
VGKTGKKELTIKNTDSKKSGIDVTITGETTAAPFAVKKQCAKKLKPGKTCKVEVTFTPTDTTTQAGELTVNDDATGALQMIPLSAMVSPFVFVPAITDRKSTRLNSSHEQ